MIYLPKSQPVPICLAEEKKKASGNYNCGDVLQRLQIDFKNKCYICEFKETPSINIEHFVPHQQNIDLKFDWNNLFFACGHCNNTKLAGFDNILNCTQTIEVETSIKYLMKPYPKEQVVIQALTDEERTIQTSRLLEKVYNGHITNKIMEAANLRSHLLREIRNFQDLLCDYVDDTFDFDDKANIRTKIIRAISDSSSFTAFKRWIIRENAYFYSEFQDYLS
jgi:HNH endonuclease